MKTILIISGLFLFFAGSQICSCGNSCSIANAQTLSVNQTVNEPKTVKLKITGMTCAGCSNHISTALKNVNGIIEQSVEYPGDLATITYEPTKTNPEAIIKVIEKTGYKAEIIKETQKKKV
jgi:copper chaperone CopZ